MDFDFSGIGDFFSDVGGKVGDLFSSGPTQVAGPGTDTGASFGDIASNIGSGIKEVGGDILGGLKGGLGSFGDLAKGILPAAQIGGIALGGVASARAASAAAEQAKIQKRAQETQERAAVPLTNFGEAQLKAATAGQVPQAVQTQIDLWAKGAKQKARDYLARAGQGDSSTLVEWESYIDQQAEAMKVSAIQSESQQGVDALGKGAGVAGNVQQGAANSQASLEALITSANQALARLAGGAQ